MVAAVNLRSRRCILLGSFAAVLIFVLAISTTTHGPRNVVGKLSSSRIFGDEQRKEASDVPILSPMDYGNPDLDPVAKRHDAPNVLDSFAEKVFFCLKSGATVLQQRLPVHVRTTLTRWPYHAVYADYGGKIGGVEVIDIIKYLAPEHQESDQLSDYHNLQRAMNEHWHWGPEEMSHYAGWDTDKFKNIPMMAHAWEHAPEHIEWFFYMDADSYVFQENLLNYLKTMDPKDKIYLGRPADWSSTGLGTDGREHAIAFAHGGSGVVISRAAMEALYGPNPKSDRKQLEKVIKEGTDRVLWHCCGDSAFAMAMYQFAQIEILQPWGRFPFYNNPFQGASIRDIAVADGGWCLPYFSWHHLTSREVDELWEYEQYKMPRGVTTTFADIYRDFMLPDIVEERVGWDAAASKYAGEWEDQYNWVLTSDFANDPQSQMFSDGKGGFELDPSAKKDDCKALCDKVPNCLVWTFQPGRCTIEKNVVFRGQASNGLGKKIHQPREDDQWLMNNMISGWNISRIRERRVEAQCDSLTVSDTGAFNDDKSTSEGWYLRSIMPNSTQIIS